MPIIVPGQGSRVVLTLRRQGALVPIPGGAAVEARFYSGDGVTALSPAVLADPDAPGNDWPASVVAFDFTGEQTGDLEGDGVLLFVTLSLSGEFLHEWRVSFELGGQRSALFPSWRRAVAMLRGNQINLAASLYGSLKCASNDALWLAVRAAEAELSRRLTIPLEPAEIFPDDPTPDELAALAGRPYLIEPGYDLPPGFFYPDQWGALQLRERPVVRLDWMRLIYPNIDRQVLDVPAEWIRLDHRYGQIRVFPMAQSSAPLSIWSLQALASGRTIPHMIRVRYCAGLSDTSEHFPDVVKLVLRMAALNILQDSFLPQSGSISSDGFSQSMSADLDKFQGGIESKIDRLREQLLGPVYGVF